MTALQFRSKAESEECEAQAEAVAPGAYDRPRGRAPRLSQTLSTQVAHCTAVRARRRAALGKDATAVAAQLKSILTAENACVTKMSAVGRRHRKCQLSVNLYACG